MIPVEYREALGLEPGADLVMVLEQDELRITTTGQAVKRAQALVRSAIAPVRRFAVDGGRNNAPAVCPPIRFLRGQNPIGGAKRPARLV